ncbi:MAG: tetratricopeptide repeat protein [Chloroflexi bacterium]|nr:tetratricopeptide repeat protein [Chloroflexota bacterium]
METRDDKLSLTFGLYVLATATYSQGKFDAAFHHARRSYQEREALGDRWFAAYALIVMGDVMRAAEDYERAQEYYQASYDIKQQVNDMGGMAFAVNCLAHRLAAR